MRRQFSTLLAGSALSFVALAAPAYAAEAEAGSATAAQPVAAQPDDDSPADEVSEVGDGGDTIIVTARRREENLQEVPQTISVVTGEVLEQLNTFSFQDLSKLVSGLILNPGGPTTTIRGVSFTPSSQTTPNVAYYINEGPVQPAVIFSSLYDIGQIEVLKGPQGTFRGVSAPGGAITYYTRRPDLDEFGGTFSGTVSDLDARRLTGAFSVPVIPGRLALRIAGVADRNDNNSPRSVNSGATPLNETNSFRITVRAEPVDDLSAVFTYQRLDQDLVSFTPVVGNGALGGAAGFNVNYTGRYVQPLGQNGPAIPVGSFLSVQDQPTVLEIKSTAASAQVDYVALGQKVSYVGSYSKIDSTSIFSSGDAGNLLNGNIPGATSYGYTERWTHEGRLSSDEPLFGFLDYTLGAFHLREDPFTAQDRGTLNNSLTVNAGAFGTPLGPPIAATPNFRFVNLTRFRREPFQEELSFFGHLTAHLGERTEVSGGVRFVDFKKDEVRVNFRTDAFRAVAFVNAAGQPVNPQTTTGAPTPGAIPISAVQCGALGGQFAVTYANVCDVPAPGQPETPATLGAALDTNLVLYSASAKHQFNDNLMVYVNYGSAFRPGPPQNIVNQLVDPYVDNLRVLPVEKSQSYEVGFKATVFDRFRLDVAAYRQDYVNLSSSQGPGLERRALATPTEALATQILVTNSFFVPLKARVEGVDVDLGIDVTRNWSINAGFSWANGKFSQNDVPCFDPDFNGVADPLVSTDPFRSAATITTPGTAANLFFKDELARRNIVLQTCATSSGPLDRSNPKWNATARTEWHNDIVDGLEAFVAGNMTYRPKNDRNPGFVQEAFALFDVNLGLRSDDGWEINGFVKNLFNDRTIFGFAANDVGGSLPGGSSALFAPAGSATPSGYRSISYVPRRELGVTFKYSFGSR